MWWVSRKEFEAFKQKLDADYHIDNIYQKLLDLTGRIQKLEATLNCRDGKHEWVDNYKVNMGTTHSIVGKSEHWLGCKHCGVKNDEWEKQLIDTDLPTLKKRMCGVKPQPKRKKGKPK